ncbi:hypothetical protein B0H13DRAFT_1878939 [Mycena leptocephala]|nr:hypothetical protein B0H13DRAFT_1878939 [Mycena leptocephala]
MKQITGLRLSVVLLVGISEIQHPDDGLNSKNNALALCATTGSAFRTKYLSAGVPPTHPQALRSNRHRMEILYPLKAPVAVRIWRLELMAGTSIIYLLYTRVTVTFEFVQLVLDEEITDEARAVSLAPMTRSKKRSN